MKREKSRMLLVKKNNGCFEIKQIYEKELLKNHIYKCYIGVPKNKYNIVYEVKTNKCTVYTKVKPEYEESKLSYIFPFGTKFYTNRYCVKQYETNVLLYKNYEALVKEIRVENHKKSKPKLWKNLYGKTKSK